MWRRDGYRTPCPSKVVQTYGARVGSRHSACWLSWEEDSVMSAEEISLANSVQGCRGILLMLQHIPEDS